MRSSRRFLPGMPRPARVLVLLAVLVAPFLGGCVEAEETWAFDEKGGGTYTLTVRWNADLWRRVTDVLGQSVMTRLRGRAFPLRATQWRDGLSRLSGVQIEKLHEKDTDTGLREVFLRAKFKRINDLLRWEVLARRTLRITRGREGAKAGSEEGDASHCTFVMEPIARVPVLDRLGDLLDAVEKPPPPAEGAAAARDPPPLARMGIERSAAEMVWRMVKRPLSEVRLRVNVRVPGFVTRKAGRSIDGDVHEVRFEYDFPSLRKKSTDRTVRFQWRMRSFDVLPLVSQKGDSRVR